MNQQRRMRFLSLALATSALIVAVIIIRFVQIQYEYRAPYFHDSFQGNPAMEGSRGSWRAFAGEWQILNGTMVNTADDRGARLMNGDTHWHNYQVEGDVQLLSETGDAGFVIRSTGEEIGVDSYHGYFAGLRDLDDTLILGRADYGWREYRAIPFQPGVQTGTWYHLRVIAFECTIAVSATAENRWTAVASVRDPDCIEYGRFGLQSYSTGAVWRDIDVRPATERDVEELLHDQQVAGPPGVAPIPAITDIEIYKRDSAPIQRELHNYQTNLHAVPIASLRLLPSNYALPTTVHGVVTLVSPVLFAQDSSGGIAIPQARFVTPVQIGDAVEISGNVEQHEFSPVLKDASVKLLWSHASSPPIAVTASQAATGVFDAQFIETEGNIVSLQGSSDESVLITLREGGQAFVGIAEHTSSSIPSINLQTGSRVRVRGVCVTDRRFTQNKIPFAVLMRSIADIQIVEPPPWWNMRHVTELFIGLIVISFGLQLAYSSVKRSQLRAVIEERERLAMDMHDTLAQSFAGLGLQLEVLCDKAEPGTQMKKQLASTLNLARFGHMEARRNIAALRPGNLEQLGLAKALEKAAQAIVQDCPIAIRSSIKGRPRKIPLRIADPLLRIGQEAIANAVRHAHPQSISICLVFGRPSLKLVIRDDGLGFSEDNEGCGFGIRGMNRRAESIGAIFRIHSTPGRGTAVTVRVRLPQSSIFSWWSSSIPAGN